MSVMDRVMEFKLGRMSTEQKQEMMASMMPKMMEDMGPGDMRAMMGEMMPNMMEKMGGGDPSKMMEGMHEMMPRMMEHCLGSMSKEERKKMVGFCRGMLDEMEEKYVK
jgi:hypothetical protein